MEREDHHVLLEEARRLLGECGLFRGVGLDERKALLSRVQVRDFVAGETIFMKGSPGDTILAVLSGSVRISVDSAEGRGLVLAILFPGEFFGEIAVLDGKERTADAIALTACSLAILGRREILSVLERYPVGWPRIVAVLCGRLRKTDDQFADVALLQLPVRLAKVLLRIMAENSRAKPGQYRVQLLQRELGELIGATRESVNKYLRSWQRDGILVIEKGQITIADRTALEDLAGQRGCI